MLFERFEDRDLSHYSYAVGCPGAGSVAIVDPRRDIQVYLDFARENGLKIVKIFETHIHADFASGARELAERTGAELCVSAYDKGEVFEVQFRHTDVEDGDTFEIGNVRIEAVHTPGHTPEHLSYLVYDQNRSTTVPMLLLSGDFLFVGSLGRPDLLGEEAKLELAERLYDSVVTKLASLPDGVEVHPAHGAGSMCGAGMSGRPFSTLGYERQANPYLSKDLTREAFIDRILTNVPPFPPYYRRMKKINSDGPALLGGVPGTGAIELNQFRQFAESGHVVVDLRDYLAFGGGHVPKSLGIGLRGNFTQWASWAVPYDTPILLVAESASQATEAARRLIRVGLDLVEGHLEGGIGAWFQAGYPLTQIRQLSPVDLHDALAAAESGAEAPRVLDVRTANEWSSGHIAGASHLMAGTLADRLDEIPKGEGPVALVCGTGYRSTVAASVLERAGLTNLVNVPGGMRAWREASLPVVSD